MFGYSQMSGDCSKSRNGRNPQHKSQYLDPQKIVANRETAAIRSSDLDRDHDLLIVANRETAAIRSQMAMTKILT